MGALQGARVRDAQMMLGEGTVLEHDAVAAVVKWDNDPTRPTRSRWVDLELDDEATR